MLAATAAVAAAANPSFIPSCSSSYSSFHQIQNQSPKPRTPSFSLSLPISSRTHLNFDLGFCGNRRSLSCWSGLKQLTIKSPSFSPITAKRRRLRGKVVYASLFGVGAPEALVIGVVALLVFGPKGLAEVARNLGKTLRAFQPTIRELQDVSREFKSTLEKEIGLDDMTSPTNTTSSSRISNEYQQPKVDPNGAPSSAAYTSEDLLEVTQEQLAAAAAAEPQSQASSPSQDQQGQTTSDVVADAPSQTTTSSAPESAAQIQPSAKPES